MNELLPLFFVPTTSTLLEVSNYRLKVSARIYLLEWGRIFAPAHPPWTVDMTWLGSIGCVVVSAAIGHARSPLGQVVSVIHSGFSRWRTDRR
jgi:hypothetical protein